MVVGKARVIGCGLIIAFGAAACAAQENDSQIRVNVNLVQLNVAVTNSKGNYVTGLRPQDFTITEDGIKQDIATFGEGNEAARPLAESASAPGKSGASLADRGTGSGVNAGLGDLQVSGSRVFVLFDTSNYMYRGFVFAQDAIAEFIRSLQSADSVAFYSYSRDLSRTVPLTQDQSRLLRGVRSSVAGDDAALYNCLLLTVQDAAQYTGRKVIVVFSNGPDNSSMVPPEDVAELAQSTGTAIYMISTREAELEPVSTAVFERMTADTGGKVYFAKNWKDEELAFASIRDDLAHLYSISYYPRPNPNGGWRTITVKLTGEQLKSDRIRTRNGYRLQPARSSAAASGPEPAAQ